MPIYDITLPISPGMVVWPGDPPVQMSHTMHLDQGDMCTVTRLDMSAHTGTHLDAPAHFISGAAGVAALDLEVLIGPALVVEALEVDALSAAVLDSLDIPPATTRVLFHTRNSALWARGDPAFHEDYVGVTPDGARWLRDHGLQLVGVDYLSVAAFDTPAEPHEVLLGAGIIAVEGLNLSGIEPGLYQLICLPLKLAGCDGAPVRAVLVR